MNIGLMSLLIVYLINIEVKQFQYRGISYIKDPINVLDDISLVLNATLVAN